MPPPTRRNHLRIIASLACLAIAASCTRGTDDQAQDEQARPLRGGVLHVALKDDVTAAMDPAREYYAVGWGLLRVMVRTLLSYPSAPAPEGHQLIPDLATSMPRVSEDRRTYTYTLRRDVRFGPPISRPVVCADFKAAFERLLVPDLGGTASSTP